MEKLTSIDQLGREVEFNFPPQKIVSIVPSQTELLFELGLDDQIAGVTLFCVRPKDKCKKKPKVGGTKRLQKNEINALQPDLILANREENFQDDIEELEADFPVWVSDINGLDSALEMIGEVGRMTDKLEEAKALIDKINEEFATLKKWKGQPRKALYLIWRDPYMAAGKGTFIDDMMARCGFVNAVSEERYPELTIDEVRDLSPDIILLSSEPFPFKKKHRKEMENVLPGCKTVLVDGEMFSWYGSRLVETPEYFRKLRETI